MHADRPGLPLTAANADAVAAFDATVDPSLGFARDAGERMKATPKADPAMPHALRGAFFLLTAKPALLAQAADEHLDLGNDAALLQRLELAGIDRRCSAP